MIIDGGENNIKNTNSVSTNEVGEADGYTHSTCNIVFPNDTIEFGVTSTVKNIYNNTGNNKLNNNDNYTFVIFEGADNNEANGKIADIASLTTFNTLSDNIINMDRPLFLAIFKNPPRNIEPDSKYRTYLGKTFVEKSINYITTQFINLITLNPTVTIYNMYNNDITLDINGFSYNILNTASISSKKDNGKPNFYITFDVTTNPLKFDYKNASLETTIAGLNNTKKYVFILFSGLPPTVFTTNNIPNKMISITVDVISGKIGDADIKSGTKKLYLAVFSVTNTVYDENAYNTFLLSTSSQKAINKLLNTLVQLVPLMPYNVTIYNQYQKNMIFNINDISYTILDNNIIYINFDASGTCKFEYTTTNKTFTNTITGLNNHTEYVFLIIADSNTNNLLYSSTNTHEENFLTFHRALSFDLFAYNNVYNDAELIKNFGALYVIIFSRSTLVESDYITFFNTPFSKRVLSDEMLNSVIKIVKLT